MTTKRNYRKWSTADYRFIMAHFETHSNSEIAKLLGVPLKNLERYLTINKLKRSAAYKSKINSVKGSYHGYRKGTVRNRAA